jgi:hypothetical protein
LSGHELRINNPVSPPKTNKKRDMGTCLETIQVRKEIPD